ncbi:MAG: SpoIIE family protein phosphatase [Actinomycetota bacterium]
MTEQDQQVELSAIVDALPLACLLLDQRLVIRAANPAFYGLTRRRPRDVLGHPLLSGAEEPRQGRDVPEQQTELIASVQRVFTSGIPDQLPLFRHDVVESTVAGPATEHWWSVQNLPVRGGNGSVAYVLYTIRDVTIAVRDRERLHQSRQHTGTMRRRASDRVRAPSRTTDTGPDTAPNADVGRRLQGIAYVALELAAAESVEELTELIISRGLGAMGCDGGGIAIRDENAGIVQLITTDAKDGLRHYEEHRPDAGIPAVVAAVSAEPVYLSDPKAAAAWHPRMTDSHQGWQAWASLPLQSGGRLLGSLVATWAHPRTWSQDDKALLAAFAAQCAQALRRIEVRQAERRAMATSRLLSESLQRSLLTEPPPVKGIDLAARYLPASRETYVGGDWYDAFELPGERLIVVIGDVTGHDRVATVGMAQIRGVLRGVAHSLDGSPANTLTALDNALHDLGADTMATSVIAQLESGHTPGTRRLRWSNAGHPPPLLIHADGRPELLQPAPELMIGVDPDTERKDHEIRLDPGDTILLYTDGLVERRDEALEHGLLWLQRRVTNLHGLPLDAFCDALLAEIPRDAEDDVALLALRALAPGGARATMTGPTPVVSARRPPSIRPIPVVTEPEKAPAPRSSRPYSGAFTESHPTAGTPRLTHRAALALIPDIASVRRARTFVRHHCRAAGIGEDATDVVALLTSETVTNAFIHGRSEARLRILIRPGKIRVEVGDDNARHPHRAPRNDDALDGRGLDIVELLSTAWGVQDDTAGKIVWFEVQDDDTS